ncbi:MAG: spore germination protein [Actinobacteria bacterium]|nr:spore germination protein [Actinomycetota bacterium]
MASVAGRDTWMVGFVFLLYGIFFIKLMFSPRVYSPGRGLAGQAASRLGPLGVALTLVAAAYIFMVLLINLADFVDFFELVMSRTPSGIFRGTLLILSTAVLVSGVEVLGRVAFILLPGVVLLLLGGAAGNLPSFEAGTLLPLLERGPEPVIRAGFMQVSYTSEIIALGFLAGRLGCRAGQVRRASYLGLSIVVLLFFGVSFFLFGVLGEDYAMRSNFKVFSLFHYGVKDSSTGFESLFILFWVSVFFIKASLLQGALGEALGEITSIRPGGFCRFIFSI